MDSDTPPNEVAARASAAYTRAVVKAQQKTGNKNFKAPLFWVLTAPANEVTRDQEIFETWGRKVAPDSLVFWGAQESYTTAHGYKFL